MAELSEISGQSATPALAADHGQAGLYLHIPFCLRKCPYCSFYSRPPQQGDFTLFTEAILAHVELLARHAQVQDVQFSTIFFGGGTPSVLPAQQLSTLLHACRETCSFADDPEISIEVNPGTVDARSLQGLRQAGWNRLSIGVQSFKDGELGRLGRIHSAQDARQTVSDARGAGFANISLDLMYGLPGQQLEDWRYTLEQALSLEPAHLSLYELTPEEPSPLYDAIQRSTTTLPHEDEILAMMACTEALITASPLSRYEISNYARPGRQCRHNLNYWHNGSYLGLGPGAVSSLAGCRYSIPPDLSRYHHLACSGQSAWIAEECLSPEQSFRETVIMGLRMLEGVSARTLMQRYQLDLRTYYGTVLDRLIDQGLLVWRNDSLALTRKGLPLANQVMAALV